MNSQGTRFLALAIFLAAGISAVASENTPHLPYALWADVPGKGQFVFGIVYEESEAYHIWAGRAYHRITVKASGEEYGIDINQGYLALQYGITEKWAADLSLGFTTAGWRSFNSTNGHVRSVTGLMDTSLGVRYQLVNEAQSEISWMPTTTLRAGAVLPGTYDEGFPFAPGNRSAAIEPELLLRKHFGWPGLGIYADALFRWNRTTHNDQYITSIGFFQQIQRWELDVGYRHLQSITGEDIVLNDDHTIIYPRNLREISDTVEYGFSYTSPESHWRWGFNGRSVFDGSNTDRKFWVGASLEIPLGGSRSN
jgi:hypothetical protein